MRLTAARYFTPAGRSIPAKGITPDIEVLQDAPDDIKARPTPALRGEASLRGHLEGDDGKEQTGSRSLHSAGQKGRQLAAESAAWHQRSIPPFRRTLKNAWSSEPNLSAPVARTCPWRHNSSK